MRGALVIGCMAAATSSAGCGPGRLGGYADREIYCCGGRDVFLVNVDEARRDPARRIWSWRAGDSPEIAVRHRAWFRAMDECRPVLGGSAVLVSSSSAGGIALVRRADKKCLFYAGGRNAHSAALIDDDSLGRPGKLVAGAFSFRSDHLRLYSLAAPTLPARREWLMRLGGAHGAVWDRTRQVLWALGSDELLKLEVIRGERASAEVLKRWKLPGRGGHDLFALDEGRLAVTVGDGAYQFDLKAEEFSPLAGLAGKANVKSVCRHPTTGEIIYTQGEPVFTNKVRFLGGHDLVLPVSDLYKARWNAPDALGGGAEPSRSAGS